MRVDGDVRGAGVVARGLDVGDGRELDGAVRRDVRPRLAVVAGELDESVHGPRPDDTLRNRRLRDGKDNDRALDIEVVRHEPATRPLLGGVVGGEIGTDHFPTLSAVPRAMDVLAAGVDG